MTIAARSSHVVLGALVLAVLTACERPPIDAVQTGYRGTGMEQLYNPRLLAMQIPRNQPPPATPAVPQEGPKAGEVYKNVQVLSGLSVGEFTRTMVALTSWVSPEQGCAYCHKEGEDFSADTLYTKQVARRMLQMTQHVNADWKPHVAGTGVTCYTCHRGQPVPADVWYAPQPRKYAGSLLGNDAGQNLAAQSVGLSSLPYDPFTEYLLKDRPIRVNGDKALAMTGGAANRHSTKQAEFAYALMMHMSSSLGVNCTFCHNTRAFQSWSESTPQRVTAWHGIRMARDLNVAYLEPLTKTFPNARLGPMGDVAKVNCATCHQGAYKPLYGAPMAKDYPALLGPVPPYVASPPAGLMAKVLFAIGSADLDAGDMTALADTAAKLQKFPDVKVAISGYADKRGKADKNLELAKQRAFVVRDALMGAGVATDRIVMMKPEFVIGGAEDDARRVEVNVAP